MYKGQDELLGLVALGVLDTLKEERKERRKSKGHSGIGELKKRN